ncbi:hypothetical protein CCB80_05760 [Armatimonadetes bacterium Uphvl-Ar1]|nr:hypothetical protein CCB80_05760 [Armatimonadetes bacterium Uphvl-Ar1]
MRKNAFTLIELLVVIAIIAILAAILFPVFAQAKVAAKKTQALSNLKNIGTAAQIYMADYDDVWPLWSAGMGCTAAQCPPRPGTSDTGSVFDLRFMFPSLIDPYIKNGVNSTTNELKDIWVSPLSDGLRPAKLFNTFAYNHWTLGGFSTCARTINVLTSGVCVTRGPEYAEFADLSYNFPASSTALGDPAGTIAFSDGSQLSRPRSLQLLPRRLMFQISAFGVQAIQAVETFSTSTVHFLLILKHGDADLRPVTGPRFLTPTVTQSMFRPEPCSTPPTGPINGAVRQRTTRAGAETK